MVDNNENQDLSLGAAIFVACLCMSFGANAVAIKISMTGIGPFTSAGLRFSIAGVAIIIWAIITGKPMRIKKEQLIQLLIVSILFTAQLGLFYFGMSKTNASRGTLLANLQPFFVLLLAHFFIPGDSITRRKIIGILLGFAGVVFMFLEKNEVTNNLRTGDLFVLFAVVIWACNSVYVKVIISQYSPYQLVLYPMLFSIPVFFIAGVIFDKPLIGHIDFQVTVSMLYQGLVTASFGYVAWNTMLKKYGAVSLHSFLFLLPVTGVALGGIILGETVATGNIVLSLAFITVGILIVHTRFYVNREH